MHTSTDRPAPPWRGMAIFLVLGFALSWYPWVLRMFFHLEGNGGPNPLGLVVAALIASAADGGWRGVKALLGRMVKLRFSPGVWLAGLLLAPASFALTLGLSKLAGATLAAPAMGGPELLDRFIFIFLFIGIGEEPAWRGFMLPFLRERVSPLAGALAAGAVWALWHLPLMGTEFSWHIVPFFVVNVIAASVVLAWLFNASGSVLLTMLVHASINVVGAYAFHPVGEASASMAWLVHALVWCALAGVVVWRTRGRLGLAPPTI